MDLCREVSSEKKDEKEREEETLGTKLSQMQKRLSRYQNSAHPTVWEQVMMGVAHGLYEHLLLRKVTADLSVGRTEGPSHYAGGSGRRRLLKQKQIQWGQV